MKRDKRQQSRQEQQQQQKFQQKKFHLLIENRNRRVWTVNGPNNEPYKVILTHSNYKPSNDTSIFERRTTTTTTTTTTTAAPIIVEMRAPPLLGKAPYEKTTTTENTTKGKIPNPIGEYFSFFKY